MNQIVEDMLFSCGLLEDSDYLSQEGVSRRSGRYPWGSGKNPNQHSGDIISRFDGLKEKGMSDKDIMDSLGINTSEYRVLTGLAKDERRSLAVTTAKDLKGRGMGPTEIGKQMGVPESTVRSYLNDGAEVRMGQSKKVANLLKEQVDTKGMIDVGAGTERNLGISKEKMKQALYILQLEGYPVYGGGVPQATNPGKQINLKILCPPGTEHKEIFQSDKIHYINDIVTRDGGETFDRYKYPTSIDPARVKIKYKEEGGIDKDGVIEIRRGVPDLDLGGDHYAQVRILVGKDRYLKGMAIYNDNLPDGTDIVFNTNKKQGTDKRDVLKKITADPDNPFGSLIKANGQSTYVDSTGKTQLSAINKRASEGDWEEWKDKLPSQFLAKQNMSLINRQLNLAYEDKMIEFNDIMTLNNPTVKKQLLQSFADDCDSTALHLSAAALPGQKYHVILPIASMKDTEIYAPKYENGTKLALIRYPHGGTFEIPILTVNNKHTVAKKLLGPDVKDAVGINSKVAEILSGADFDGDTVMTIPTHGKNGIKITSKPPLEDLEGFDPKYQYGYDEVRKDAKGDPRYYRSGKEFKIMKNTGLEMGVASNLITDMTLKGATNSELARAVKHSMVVIDAEKHKLDYRQSYIDNDIKTLKKAYQGVIENGKYHEGASTLISKAKSEATVLRRQGTPKVNLKDKEWYDPTRPEGSLIYKEVYEEYVDKKGKTHVKTIKSSKMLETDDARTLSSGTVKEDTYADYANNLKALANRARIEKATTGNIKYSAAAKEIYKEEVKRLDSALNIAMQNHPRERQAQLMTNSIVKAKIQDNPGLAKDKKELKKLKQQTLANSRIIVGAKREPIVLSDREWEAIQAGAVSETKLSQIIQKTDIDSLRERATPRTYSALTQAQQNKIALMRTNGYTIEEISRRMSKSPSTITKYLK